jgi:hypothetical protein
MKMQLEMSNLLVSGQMTETDISVGDPRIIIHHLVKSVYQFAKITMVQEYTSNARDANVEAGNGHLPIEIKVPNTLDTNLIISDRGIGITPDRMHNVFVKIGNSTKREDNMSDGAFGIGSKIGLAYTNQFTVKTITQEGEHLIRRLYAVVKRDDFSIKLMTLGEPHIVNSADDACDQHTGTAITIPVEARDVAEVRRAVVEKTEFWTVRPTITGATVEEVAYPTRDWFYTCDEFRFILEGNGGYGYNGTVVALINGVPYPVKHANEGRGHIYSSNSAELPASSAGVSYTSFRGTIYLNFKVGEITPALSRESLQYDDRTRLLIKERVESAIKVVKGKVKQIIDAEPTYLQAYAKMQAFQSASWIEHADCTWQGHKLEHHVVVPMVKNADGRDVVPADAPVTFMSFRIDHNDKMKDRGENQYRMHGIAELFAAKLPIIYTEKPSLNTSAVKYLVRNSKNTAAHSRNQNLIAFRGKRADIEKFLTDRHLECLIPQLECLETCGYVRAKRIPGAKGIYKTVMKWMSTGRWRNKLRTNGEFDPTDPKDCGYYYIYDRKIGDSHLKVSVDSKEVLDHREIYALENALNVKVCGVSPGNIKFLNKAHWKPLGDLFKNGDNAELLKSLTAYQEYVARQKSDDKTAFSLGDYAKIDCTKFDAKSPMRLWMEAVKALPAFTQPKLTDMKNSNQVDEVLRSFVKTKMIKDIHHDSKNHPVVALHLATIKAYPMLKYIERNGYSRDTSTNNADTVAYVILCDTVNL